MDFAPVRGMADLLPPASGSMRTAMQAAARLAKLRGYLYVETPALEPTELFARTSGESSDVVRKEMYTFEDRGGRLLTMRPEATAGIVRAYLNQSHDLPSPFKAYSIEQMWRYGRPQAGRLREFRQFDLEIIGTAAPPADVEVAAVGYEYLHALGLRRFELQVNSIGDGNCRPAYRERLLAYLEENRERLRDEHRDRFRDNPLRVLDCKDRACMAVAAKAPKIIDQLCGPCREHFAAVLRGLEEEAVPVSLVPTLVRGLDYYTRTTFEYVSGELSASQASVGGGGRYDGLAEILGGPSTPGVGFALGLERILLALRKEGGEAASEPRELMFFLVAMGEDARPAARSVARQLRAEGWSAAEVLEPRSLKAQLRMADRSGARFALIIGPREAEDGTVTARRLADGQQWTVRPAELSDLATRGST